MNCAQKHLGLHVKLTFRDENANQSTTEQDNEFHKLTLTSHEFYDWTLWKWINVKPTDSNNKPVVAFGFPAFSKTFKPKVPQKWQILYNDTIMHPMVMGHQSEIVFSLLAIAQKTNGSLFLGSQTLQGPDVWKLCMQVNKQTNIFTGDNLWQRLIFYSNWARGVSLAKYGS